MHHDEGQFLAAESRHERFMNLDKLIGNTPMLALDYRFKGSLGRIYVKCEYYSLTGSVKDRMALYILKRAYENGLINPGDTIIEATSGNTGISFAALGRSLGHPVHIIMPDWLSTERFDIIRSLGATITKVSKEAGGFLKSIELAKSLAKDGKSFLPSQFENLNNPAAHEHTTAKEIINQLQIVELQPTAFIAGVGTGGTIMGVGRGLKKQFPSIRIHPLEPAESPTLSTGYKVGSHRIQGISDEFIPSIVKLDQLNGIVQVYDGDAIITAQKVACELGLGVGISSGANIAGAIRLQQELGKDAVVVTLLCDNNSKYLSTDMMKDEAIMPHYISSDLEFVSYDTILTDNSHYINRNR